MSKIAETKQKFRAIAQNPTINGVPMSGNLLVKLSETSNYQIRLESGSYSEIILNEPNSVVLIRMFSDAVQLNIKQGEFFISKSLLFSENFDESSMRIESTLSKKDIDDADGNAKIYIYKDEEIVLCLDVSLFGNLVNYEITSLCDQ